MKLILDQTQDVTDQIRLMAFRSSTDDVLPSYSAGAHLEFDLGAVGKRAYSLIDWPTQSDLYTIAVQKEDEGEGGSKAMHALNVGDTIDADHPKNDFPLTEIDAPVLLLAGGIGITPLISMASELFTQNRPFQLHYTARNAARMGFSNTLADAFGPHLSISLDDTNPLDLSSLMNAQTTDTQVYICGPKPMIDAARSAATAAGIPEDAIHIELFSTPSAQDGDTAFEVELKDTGQVITVAADQTIIQALEDAGVDVMYDCQRGDCGICQCDVISGTPDHRDVVLSDAERDAGNVMQICVSRAKSDRLVLDI